MSSPQSSHSQLDPSLTSDVHTLIAPFSSLSIESHGVEQVVESEASRELKEGEFLLNDEVYISAARVVRKRQRTFWAFRHGEEVIRSRTMQQAGCVVYVKRWEASSYTLLHQPLGWAST